MPRIFIHLDAGCLQVNLMSTSTQINLLKYTIYYTKLTGYISQQTVYIFETSGLI